MGRPGQKLCHLRAGSPVAVHGFGIADLRPAQEQPGRFNGFAALVGQQTAALGIIENGFLGVFNGTVPGLIVTVFDIPEAAFLNDPGRLAVPIKMPHQKKIQSDGIKQISSHGLYGLRHQPTAPVVPGECIAQLPASEPGELRVMFFVIFFDPQSADDVALIFQGKGLLLGDKAL